MKRPSILITVGFLAALSLSLTACASTASEAEPVPGIWVDAQVDGDSVTVPLALIEEHSNLHFEVEQDGRSLAFMAYVLDGEIQVRANACPPCGSRGFTLDGHVLDCDACHTLFDARDGSGIEGACVDYPKAAVPYDTDDGSIVMSVTSMVNAYDDTLVAG